MVILINTARHLLSLEKCDVEDGGVEINKLEDENLESKIVFVLSLGTMHL